VGPQAVVHRLLSLEPNPPFDWGLAGLVGFNFIGSAFVKLSGSAAREMAEGIGVTRTTLTLIGIIELISVMLFIIPRTGVLGTLLLIAYMGGAIASHVILEESFLFPAAVAAFVWIAAVIRFPELTRRIAASGNP
jgi:hypothetical protein